MRYHSTLTTRVRQADDAELARLLRLYPRNGQLASLVAAERRRRWESPKPIHPFTPLPRV